MKRADQRLDEADGAVRSGDVRPGFERVRRGQMPDGGLGRFIEIESQVEAERRAGHQRREVEIAGRRGHRIQSRG